MNHDTFGLRRALFTNAAFSGITGLGALALAPVLAEWLGPPVWGLRALGAGLLVFAALVAREARRPGRAGTLQIIAADLAWVVTAAILIALSPSWLTGTGRGHPRSRHARRRCRRIRAVARTSGRLRHVNGTLARCRNIRSGR